MPFSEALKQYNYAMDRGQRRRLQEQQAERQHSMDLFSIQRAHEQDARAKETHEWNRQGQERATQTHGAVLEAQNLSNESSRTAMNMEANDRIAKAFVHTFDPETRQYRDDPQAVQEFQNTINREFVENERVGALFSNYVTQITGNKYNGLSVRNVSQQGDGQFAIEFHNTETGANGVMTENASTDPDDNVVILTGEQLQKFYQLGAGLAATRIDPRVFNDVLGGESRQPSVLLDEAEPEWIVSSLKQVYEAEPSIEPFEAVKRVENMLPSAIEGGGEDEASTLGVPYLDAASAPATAPNLRDIPAAMRGIHLREQRLNAKLGVAPTREHYEVNTPQQDEPELRPGQRVNKFFRENNAINTEARDLERRGSNLGIKGPNIGQFFADVFGYESNDNAPSPKPDAKPVQIPKVDSENFTEQLQQSGGQLASGDARPNATHRKAVKHAIDAPRESTHQERAVAAAYMIGTGVLTLHEAERFAHTGTVDPTALNLRGHQADAHRRLLDQQNKDNAKIMQDATNGFGQSLDAVNSLADNVFKSLGGKDSNINENTYPELRGHLSSVISRLFTERAFGSRSPEDVTDAINATARSSEFVQNVNSPMFRSVVNGAIAETHRQISSAPNKNKPDFETTLLNNVVRRMNGIEGSVEPREAELMIRFSDIVGRDVGLLTHAYKALEELKREGRTLRQISVEDLLPPESQKPK